jgi:4-amino-4-deoxy-L-arabinose transferase-like glycosyltransferase
MFSCLSLALYTQIKSEKSHQDIDSGAYLTTSDILYSKGSLKSIGQMPYFTLGYPIFMAIIYKLTGQQAKKFIVAVNMILSILSIFLIFYFTAELFGISAGWLAAFLLAINIGYLIFCQFILSEVLLSLFLLLFLFSITKFASDKCHNPSVYRCLITAGLFLGTSVVIKPAALYFPILLSPAFLFMKSSSHSKKFLNIFLFISAFYVPIAGYMLHNKIVFNQFAISNMEGVNSNQFFVPNVLAEKNGTDPFEERKNLQKSAAKLGLSSPSNILPKLLKTEPMLCVFVWAKNVLKTFLGLFTSNLKILVDPKSGGEHPSFFSKTGSVFEKTYKYLASGSGFRWVIAVGIYEIIFMLLRYILCIFALVKIALERRFMLLYLVMSYIFYFALITGHDGCARFRMFFEFLLTILAAYGATEIWSKFKQIAKEKL